MVHSVSHQEPPQVIPYLQALLAVVYLPAIAVVVVWLWVPANLVVLFHELVRGDFFVSV